MDSGLINFLLYGLIAAGALALLIRNTLRFIKEGKEEDATKVESGTVQGVELVEATPTEPEAVAAVLVAPAEVEPIEAEDAIAVPVETAEEHAEVEEVIEPEEAIVAVAEPAEEPEAVVLNEEPVPEAQPDEAEDIVAVDEPEVEPELESESEPAKQDIAVSEADLDLQSALAEALEAEQPQEMAMQEPVAIEPEEVSLVDVADEQIPEEVIEPAPIEHRAEADGGTKTRTASKKREKESIDDIVNSLTEFLK